MSFGDQIMDRCAPTVISLADTVGAATPELVESMAKAAVGSWGVERVGVHLHLHPLEGLEKTKAAHRGGCLRMDGALRGVGGCPMAQDDLVGNAPSERVIEWARQSGLWQPDSLSALDQAESLAADLFG
jgi:hydroxymethylglutaryl-CoA lyase